MDVKGGEVPQSLVTLSMEAFHIIHIYYLVKSLKLHELYEIGKSLQVERQRVHVLCDAYICVVLRRQGIARALCCLSDAGVIAAVMSACSSGSSNLATCFCHRFALDGSAALWDGWDCMQEYSYRVE
uniref:Uncharacterized protein n=1 Tax=Onchocerca volvulus TaxID=6282 RepID=A0A8R1Y047_ONCVO